MAAKPWPSTGELVEAWCGGTRWRLAKVLHVHRGVLAQKVDVLFEPGQDTSRRRAKLRLASIRPHSRSSSTSEVGKHNNDVSPPPLPRHASPQQPSQQSQQKPPQPQQQFRQPSPLQPHPQPRGTRPDTSAAADSSSLAGLTGDHGALLPNAWRRTTPLSRQDDEVAAWGARCCRASRLTVRSVRHASLTLGAPLPDIA